MASAVDICNQALSILGQTLIVSLEDQTSEALACRTLWVPMRNSYLRDHKWNCVKRRSKLSRLTTSPAFGYRYYYQLPTKCLMALKLDDGSFFEVEGRKILTDSGEANLHYIEADDDVTNYDSQLADAMAHELASRLAPQMTSSSSEASRLHEVAKDLFSMAKASDAFEGKQRTTRGNRLLSAKYGN